MNLKDSTKHLIVLVLVCLLTAAGGEAINSTGEGTAQTIVACVLGILTGAWAVSVTKRIAKD